MSNVKKSERGESKMAFFNAIMNMNELDKVVLHFNKLFCEELYYNTGYITYKKPY